MKTLAFALITLSLSSAVAIAFWEPTNGPLGGSLRAAIVTASGDFLVAEFSGGVYRSSDLGQTWSRTSLTVKGITALAAAPNNDVFAGGWFPGIHRSTDDGITWQQVADFKVEINAILAPTDGIVLVGGWRTDTPPSPGFLLARSTDHGTTWTQYERETGLVGSSLHDFALRADGGIYAATGVELGGIGGVYVSNDNGATWAGTSTPLPHWVAVAVNATTVVAGGEGESLTLSGVHHSTDGGAHWTLSNSGLTWPYVQSLSTGPDQTFYVSSYGSYRSIDNGLTWLPTNLTYTAHAKLAFHPGGAIVAPTELWGAFRSVDGGMTWNESNRGLPHTVVDALAVTPSGVVVAGDAHRLYRSTNKGESWMFSTFPGFRTRWILVDANGILFAGGSAGILSSDDDGASWQPTAFHGWTHRGVVLPNNDLLVNSGGWLHRSSNGFATWTTSPSPEGSGHFMNSMAVAADGTIFGVASAGGVFRSTDDAATWTNVTHGLTGFLRVVGAHPDGTVYVSNEGYLFRSDDNGDTWTPSGLNVGAIAFQVDPSGRIFVANGTLLYHSIDGTEWTQIIDDLPAGVRSMSIGADGTAYLGLNGFGVYRSERPTTSASPLGSPTTFSLEQNIPNPFNPRTVIRMALPQESPYSLSIFDVRGRLVRSYQDRSGPGIVTVVWDGRDASGYPVPSGIYVYTSRAGAFESSRKMILLR